MYSNLGCNFEACKHKSVNDGRRTLVEDLRMSAAYSTELFSAHVNALQYNCKYKVLCMNSERCNLIIKAAVAIAIAGMRSRQLFLRGNANSGPMYLSGAHAKPPKGHVCDYCMSPRGLKIRSGPAHVVYSPLKRKKTLQRQERC